MHIRVGSAVLIDAGRVARHLHGGRIVDGATFFLVRSAAWPNERARLVRGRHNSLALHARVGCGRNGQRHVKSTHRRVAQT